MLMNLAGDTTSFRSVLIDSALGLQAKNTPFFHKRMKDLEAWLRQLPPPAYPLPTDPALAAQGKAVFEAQCASCHDGSGQSSGHRHSDRGSRNRSRAYERMDACSGERGQREGA
jgi:mono/diheme cytochrome c family protein